MCRKRLIVLLLITVLGGCAHEDPWTRGDTMLYAGYVAAGALDTKSTSRFQYYPDIYEVNPAVYWTLGRSPSTPDLWQAYISVVAVNYFVARALPTKWRTRYLGVWTVGHGAAWINNCRLLEKKSDSCM